MSDNTTTTSVSQLIRGTINIYVYTYIDVCTELGARTGPSAAARCGVRRRTSGARQAKTWPGGTRESGGSGCCRMGERDVPHLVVVETGSR